MPLITVLVKIELAVIIFKVQKQYLGQPGIHNTFTAEMEQSERGNLL